MPRQRKTAEENAARGNPGRRPLIVAPVGVLPTLDVQPPGDLSPDAAAVWALLAPDLIAMKILRRTDALTFSIFCESFARYARALIALRREGDVQWVKTVSGDKMRRVNPRVVVLREERRIVLAYSEKFGLTPVDRFKVIQYLAGGGGLPPDPSQPPLPSADEPDLLEREADPLSDQGPVGALGLAH